MVVTIINGLKILLRANQGNELFRGFLGHYSFRFGVVHSLPLILSMFPISPFELIIDVIVSGIAWVPKPRREHWRGLPGWVTSMWFRPLSLPAAGPPLRADPGGSKGKELFTSSFCRSLRGQRTPRGVNGLAALTRTTKCSPYSVIARWIKRR